MIKLTEKQKRKQYKQHHSHKLKTL